MTKLFIGNLPYSTTSEELNQMFSEKGQVVSAQVVTDKFTGRSRGFGFVEMSNDDEAQKAIQDLNNANIGDRQMSVSVARPREDRPSGGNRGGFGGGSSRDFNRNRGGYNKR